jgi:hypothetical protein
MSSFAAWAEKVDTSEVDRAKEELRASGECKYAIGYISQSQIGQKQMEIPFFVKLCFWNDVDGKCKMGYYTTSSQPKGSTYGRNMPPVISDNSKCTKEAIRKTLNQYAYSHTSISSSILGRMKVWEFFRDGDLVVGDSKYKARVLHDELGVGGLQPGKKK